MLELKTGPVNQPRYVNEMIVQLLVYTLLAIHDGRPVTHVAVYATRHQRLLRRPVVPLLYELHGRAVDPVVAGAMLATQIIADQPEPAPAGVAITNNLAQ